MITPKILKRLLFEVMRRPCKYIYKLLIFSYARLTTKKPTKNKCIVFSPHQDDETLGCGGTIISKRNQGVDVLIVYMTDGGNSHKLMIKDELVKIRKNEAITACKLLGVDESNIVFLNFDDGILSEDADIAKDKVMKLLNDFQPDEVYTPFHKDGHGDHLATTRIVTSAIKSCGKEMIVYEYPTWFWNHWPLTRLNSDEITLNTLKMIVKSIVNVFSYLRFTHEIKDMLDGKRAALYAHKTQNTRFDAKGHWANLSDISEGEWLECFFWGKEHFFRYKIKTDGRQGK